MSKIITYPFTEPFVDHLIDYIDENYIKTGQDLSRLGIVFGGKRPALFIKRALAKRLKTSFYPPRFFTIDEFIHTVVSKKKLLAEGKDLDQCYLLYILAQEAAPEILKGRGSFDQFLPWTREILKFIDQLDLENVDDNALRNIKENAQIGYAVPDDINRLLKSVIALRKAYHKALDQKQESSRGLQYLRAAQWIDEVEFDEFDQILFCNFFYFHRCEEKVVKSLYKRGQATLLFQGDQRRWPVLKRIAKTFNHDILEGDEVKTPQFDLKLYAGFDGQSQIGLVTEILKKVKDLNKTVILLPNPDHIVPLLSEITHQTQDFNISMGYPLNRSSLYSLLEFIFKAQLSFKDGRYYTKDYLKALKHPFVKNFKTGDDAVLTRILVHKIEEILTGKEKSDISGSAFIELSDIVKLDDVYELTSDMLKRLNVKHTKDDLKNILKEIHTLVFRSWEKVESFFDFANTLDTFLGEMIAKSFLKNYPLNLNIANKMYDIKDEFLNSSFSEENFPKEEIFRIFEGKVAREIVAFIGSPLKGLQILGLFETRSLNFDHVIIVDVNEGALPRLNIYEPLIPREVMISLNLDRLELEEEIQRYQFMRLISSAKDVHLVYQESKDKERSRFIEELIWEEQKKIGDSALFSGNRALSPIYPSFEVKIAPKHKHVKKTKEVVEFLKNFTYSASSVNTYLRNPMEFYTNYVLGLKEQDDLLDEPEARHVGTFVHELLEESFKPFLNKMPDMNKRFRNRFAKLFDERFEATFGRSMKSDSFLLRSVLTERLNRFLDHEQTDPQREVEKILYLENRFSSKIPLSCGKINFSYIVDRVDLMNDGTIMIVDYKTGAVDQMPRAIDHIAQMELTRESIRDYVRSFQIPLYFHYLDQEFKKEPINAALYNLRTLEFHRFIDEKMNYSRQQINETFLRALDFVLCEILNPEIDFIEDLSE